MKSVIFVYLLTYGGAVLSLFRPFYGLLIYICFAIIRPESIFFSTVSGGKYSLIVGTALCVGWVLHGLGDWRFGRAALPLFGLLGFWAWSLISTFVNGGNPDSWKFMDDITKIVLPCFIGVTLIDSWDHLKQLAWCIGISVGYVALNEHSILYNWGIPVGDNIKAHCFAVGAGVLFFVAFTTRRVWLRLVGFGFSAACVHAVMFHMSRGAMMGLCASFALVVIVIPKTPKMMALLCLGVVVAISLAGPHVVDEFGSTFAGEDERDHSAQSRIEFWKSMSGAVADYPLFGVGPRMWPIVGVNYGNDVGREGHGAWQQLYAETGIPGGTLILVFYVLTVALLFPIALGRSHSDIEIARVFAQIGVVAISAWLVEQLVGSFYSVELPYYVGLVGLATLKLTSIDLELAPAEDELNSMATRPRIYST